MTQATEVVPPFSLLDSAHRIEVVRKPADQREFASCRASALRTADPIVVDHAQRRDIADRPIVGCSST
jgi:hypothetical protein